MGSPVPTHVRVMTHPCTLKTGTSTQTGFKVLYCIAWYCCELTGTGDGLYVIASSPGVITSYTLGKTCKKGKLLNR